MRSLYILHIAKAQRENVYLIYQFFSFSSHRTSLSDFTSALETVSRYVQISQIMDPASNGESAMDIAAQGVKPHGPW